jgi:hypothetical protein
MAQTTFQSHDEVLENLGYYAGTLAIAVDLREARCIYVAWWDRAVTQASPPEGCPLRTRHTSKSAMPADGAASPIGCGAAAAEYGTKGTTDPTRP